MDAVRAELALKPQQLWAKVSDISEGRGGERAIGAVTFFTGAASGAPSATGTQLSATPQWHMCRCAPAPQPPLPFPSPVNPKRFSVGPAFRLSTCAWKLRIGAAVSIRTCRLICEPAAMGPGTS